MSKKRTTSEFVELAKMKHGTTYDYSLVDYKGSTTKVIIICKHHGEFKQIPVSHLQGHGCNKCANIKTGNSHRKTTDEFIREAKQIHGSDTYDYSLVVYEKSSIMV